MKFQTVALLCGALVLSACSTIVEGSSQDISVNTNPSGANCALMREGNVIARVNPTPGTVKISKTKHDITVDCTKEGFQKASYFNESDIAGMTVGNVILGGLVGWAIDSATGSDNKYTGAVHIELVPKDASPAEMPAAKPVSAPSSITPTS